MAASGVRESGARRAVGCRSIRLPSSAHRPPDAKRPPSAVHWTRHRLAFRASAVHPPTVRTCFTAETQSAQSRESKTGVNGIRLQGKYPCIDRDEPDARLIAFVKSQALTSSV
jgi:hypothetical protein